MQLVDIVMLLSLAFGLGMLHALDADHVMAVSGLVANRRDAGASLRFGLRWAMGHGLVLLFVGVLVFLFGVSIPDSLSHHAELIVGLMLIGIGASVLLKLYRNKAHVHFHVHDGMPAHAHWHTHTERTPAGHRQHAHHHDHAPVLVGVLHGVAGTAPLLAVIPLTMLGSPIIGLLYLLLFSLGVLLAMLLFGGLLDLLVRAVLRAGNRFFIVVRSLIGISAMLLGGLMIKGLI